MSDIDTIIAEAMPLAENQPQADVTTAETPKGEEAPQSTENTDAERPEEVKQLSPEQELEKLRKAKARDERAKGKLTAQKYQALKEVEELRAKLSKYEQQTQAKPAEDGAPRESDYETYADFIEARTEWKLEQRLKQLEGKQQQDFKANQEQQWVKQREIEINRKSEEFAKEYPQYSSVIQEHAESIQSLPDDIKLALLKADNTPLALLNLAENGVLEELGDMSLEDARVEIKLALKQPPARPQQQSKAPKPMAAARGGVASKSLESMSAEELVAKFKPN